MCVCCWEDTIMFNQKTLLQAKGAEYMKPFAEEIFKCDITINC